MDSNALNCPLSGGSPLTSGILDNTDLRSFEMGSLSLGGEVLNNPLVFTGDSWPVSMRMHFECMHLHVQGPSLQDPLIYAV